MCTTVSLQCYGDLGFYSDKAMCVLEIPNTPTEHVIVRGESCRGRVDTQYAQSIEQHTAVYVGTPMDVPMETNTKRGSREELVDAVKGDIGVCGWVILILSAFLTTILFPFSIWFCVKVVKEYERAVVFRLGRIISGKANGPGLIFILPCTDNFIKVDLRVLSFAIPPQEILTKDSVTTTVDGVVYYKIESAIRSVANVYNVHVATQQLAQTTLRNILGTQTLSSILSNREEIAHNIHSILDNATHEWGVKVERVEMRDVRLPVQMQRAMAAEAEAVREARAKVVAAEGEMNASRALKEASMVMMESPGAMQLRYLQTLNTIAAENNSTIVFPLPIDMLQGLFHKTK